MSGQFIFFLKKSMFSLFDERFSGNFILMSILFEYLECLIQAHIGLIDIVEDGELFALEEKHNHTF